MRSNSIRLLVPHRFTSNRSEQLFDPGSSAQTIIGDPMPHVYRISKSPDVGDLLNSIEALEAFARDHGPESYNVDEHLTMDLARKWES